MRLSSTAVLWVLHPSAAASARPRDVRVGSPSGTPLEWNATHRKLGGRRVYVTTEKPGAHEKILRQMALLALASLGDEAARKEVLARAAKDTPPFHGTVQYLSW